MSDVFLCCIHLVMMVLFILILVDCLWKQLLKRCFQYLLPNLKTEKVELKTMKEVKKVYARHEVDLKKAASDVVKKRLADGTVDNTFFSFARCLWIFKRFDWLVCLELLWGSLVLDKMSENLKNLRLTHLVGPLWQYSCWFYAVHNFLNCLFSFAANISILNKSDYSLIERARPYVLHKCLMVWPSCL